MDQVDHQRFGQLLKRFVDADGFVDYQAWQADTAARQQLQRYLSELSQASDTIRATRRGQLAFWINAYNAVTIEGILQVYPTDSIRSHTSRLGGYNIWKDLPLLVGGKKFSLHAIEHDVLRKQGEPRIHFAIVCASVGCPRLLNEAYVPARVDLQLAQNTADFFSRRQNLRWRPGQPLQLSSIMKWFASDFGSTTREQIESVRKYFPESVRENLPADVRVEYLEYDWALNDIPNRARIASP